MPITAAETKKYVEFVNEQAKDLKCLEVNRDDIVWHYTSGAALISIVETGTLYATQVACLNDSTEVRYGEDLLHDAFVDLNTKIAPNDEAQPLIERIVKTAVEDSGKPRPPTDWFVACFSKKRDDLSQWRAYSGGENGYAIGFRAGNFFRTDCLVVHVNYDKNQHLSIGTKLAEATLQFFREGLSARTNAESVGWMDEFLLEWSRWTNKLAPMVKDLAFQAEDEYRIIHEFKLSELSKLRFKQKESLMAIHLPMVFPPPGFVTHSTLLPITEVIVGPSRHKEVSRVSVDNLMRQKGYTAVPVSVSTIPFQTT